MILPGSYASGFAPRDGEALFPGLWRGCVVAWNPGLGPSGLTLRDWSPYKNHGTLTAATPANAWTTITGKHTFRSDGLDARVLAANSQSLAIAKDLTVAFWLYPLSSGSNAELIQKMGAGEVRINSSWEAYRNASQAIWFRLNGTENNLISNVICPANKWTHVVCRKIGATLSMFFNAVPVGTLGGQPDITISTGSLTLAAYPDGSFPINAHFDDIRIYNRGITENEIRLLASRRGIAYQMAPRRRSSSAVQFNRRRRLLLGST
jgi:hypothetical protein